MNKIKKTAIVNALLTALYVAGVGGFMYYGTMVKIGRNNAFLAPVAILMLFVCSAAITSYLMFGQPETLYVDGKKKEAIALVSYTLVTFSIITVLFLILLFLFTK